MKIGIFGGTFNPIHNGHLINGQHILEQFNLDKIVYIPSKVPVHKKLADDISPSLRLNLVNLAIKENPHFESSSIEIDRTTFSYTIETIEQLASLYNIEDLYLIIGADSLNTIDKWKSYKDIINQVKIIVMRRPGDENLRNDILDMAREIKIADNPLIEISSSMIRNYIKDKRNIQYLVPESVNKEIIEKEMYTL